MLNGRDYSAAYESEAPRLHAPLSADDRRTDTFLRTNIELIHQALGAGQAHTHATRGAIPILHHDINIRDAGPLVFANNLDPPAARALNFAHGDGAGTGVEKDIARQLADCGRDACLVDSAKAHILRGVAGKCAGNDDIEVAANDSRLTLRHRHSPRSGAGEPPNPFRGSGR